MLPNSGLFFPAAQFKLICHCVQDCHRLILVVQQFLHPLNAAGPAVLTHCIELAGRVRRNVNIFDPKELCRAAEVFVDAPCPIIDSKRLDFGITVNMQTKYYQMNDGMVESLGRTIIK